MTTWFSIGPDFVFAPRDANFKRLSRRNEAGRQGLVNSIAVDPTDAGTIYTVETPTSGGTGAFRSDDDGASWTSIVDGLQQADPNSANPSCITLHPVSTGTVYLATFSGRVYVSPNTKGSTWNTPFNLGASIFKLLLDPRSAGNVATTIIYAAASNGVWRSNDGGGSFTQVLSGNLQALAARFPTDGSSADLFAGISSVGVFHATDPTNAASWTNLNTLAGTTLPAIIAPTATNPSGNFDNMRIDVCRANRRAYIWFFNTICDAAGQNCNEGTASLFTSANPTGAWTSIAMTSPPGPAYGLYDSAFTVAPNSPGDGNNDILFFGSIGLFRSINSGRNWTDIGTTTGHADQHAFAFFPDPPPVGTVPATYVGCDGGLVVSTGAADPAAVFPEPATDFDDLDSYTTSPAAQNYSHGKQSSAIYAYASNPNLPGLSYIGCQDTGINAGDSAFGWRGIFDADGGSIGAAQGADGVKVWFRLGEPFSVLMATDRREFNPNWAGVALSGGRGVDTSSNFVVDSNGNCLGGLIPIGLPGTSLTANVATGVQTVTPASMTFIAGGALLSIDQDVNNETVVVTAVTATTFTANFTKPHNSGAGVNPISDTSIAAAVAAGVRTVTPGSMANIVVSGRLTIDGGSSQEVVTVTAVTAATFTANFTKAHSGGAPVVINHAFLGRMGQDASAIAISQDFFDVPVVRVAVHPTNADQVAFATGDQRLFTTNNATAATPVWTEVTGSKPAGLNISSLVIDNAGNLFVLNNTQLTTGSVELLITSPLFLASGSNWRHVACTNAPMPDITGFGRMVADPVQVNAMYAGHDARVYRLNSTSPGGNVTWTDISANLPGQWIYDLWVGSIGSGASGKVLLRAAIPTRGVWELDVTAGAADAALELYLRDNFLDMGRLPTPPDGVTNPYDPANPAATVYHYQCADIKVDALQQGAAGTFFQTDPEGTLPLSHVLFDQLRDNSDNLPSADSAMVHVQVRNRGVSKANNVRVWAVYCNASAGVPGLNASAALGNNFNFWSQFQVTGQVIPTLPADSPWRPIGPPQTISIDSGRSAVASWTWTVPTLASGDPGHYCIASFVHSSGSPINETGFNVDAITPTNKQIGQKNLHVGPPLPAGGDGGSGGGGGAPGGRARRMREYIEFHNPTDEQRQASFVIDTRGLPPEIRTSFVLTRLDTIDPLPSSITGIVPKGQSPSGHGHGLTGKLAEWLDRIEDELEETAGALVEWLGCWVENLGRRLEDKPPRSCAWKPHHPHRFEPTVYTALPSSRVVVKGVVLQPSALAAALISVENRGTLPPGSRYTFQVQQWIGATLVGGSAYEVRIAGEAAVIAGPQMPEDAQLEIEETQERFLPPWIVAQAEAGDARLGKKR